MGDDQAKTQGSRHEGQSAPANGELSHSDRSIGSLSVCLRLSIYIYNYASASVYLRLLVSVYPFASIYLPFASIYLFASIIYVYLYASVYRIYLRLSATASVSIWPGMSVSQSTCLSAGR